MKFFLTLIVLSSLLFHSRAAVDPELLKWAESPHDPTITGDHPESKAFQDFPVYEGLLPGFDPVGFSPKQVLFHNCEYNFENNGLLKGVTHQGVPLICAPLEIRGTINGKSIRLPLDGQPEIVKKTIQEMEIRYRGNMGEISTEVELLVEYDGLIRTRIRFHGEQEMEIKDLSVVIPYAEDQAEAIHYNGDGSRLYPNTHALEKKDGILWESLRDQEFDPGFPCGQILNALVTHVWLGNYDRGFSWFIESDKGWINDRDSPVVQINRANGRIELIFHVVMGEHKRRDLLIDFGMMATPIKKLPPEWRSWFFSFALPFIYWEKPVYPSSYRAFVPNSVKESCTVYNFVHDVHSTLPYRHSTTLSDPDGLHRFVDKHKKAGVDNLVVYTCMNLITDLNPDYDRIARNCMRLPEFKRIWPRPKTQTSGIAPVNYQMLTGEGRDDIDEHHKLTITCQNAQEFLAMKLAFIENLVENYGIAGIYLDNFCTIYECARPGCAYEKFPGEYQPQFKLYQYRDFMKKLASIFVRHNVPDYMIWVHNTSVQHPAYLTFATCTLSGELVAGKYKFSK